MGQFLSFCLFVLCYVAEVFATNVAVMSPQDVYQKLNAKDGKIMLIDVREGSEYAEASIPGSVLISKENLMKNFDFYAPFLLGKDVVVHCKSGMRGAAVTEFLSAQSGLKVYNMEGGINAWKKDNLPVVSSGISIMRQVQMTVGTIVVIFGLLGFYKERKMIFVSVAIGFGLLFAGITGSCALARILKMMPWNV